MPTDYVIHWTTDDGEEDATVVKNCELADYAQATFTETFPNRIIRHTFMVSETITNLYSEEREQ